MKSTTFILALLLGFSHINAASAQDIGSDEVPQADSNQSKFAGIKDKIYFGGNIGAQFGNYTLINVAPLVGYKITKRWSVGTQATYTYVNLKYSSYRYEDHIFGGSLFTRYFIFDNIFLHTEYETLNGNWKGNGKRFNVNSWFVGGGYMYRFSSMAGVGVTAMYNVIQSRYSPYRNPIINVGFTFGL